jgi:phospholipase/carboxylesterase
VSTVIEPQLLTFRDWTFRLRMTQMTPIRLLILIHGWMGDEDSMWVLTQKLSSKYTILAPRGPFPVPEGGYSWRKIKPGTWGMASLEDLLPSAEALLAFVDEWSTSEGVDAGQFDLMGFSQGAAMAFALTLLHPERVRRLAALSGFVPENGEALLSAHQLSGKPVFISHGRQDNLIPVEQARSAVRLFEGAGSKVTYCESDASHRVGKERLKVMEMFLGEP